MIRTPFFALVALATTAAAARAADYAIVVSRETQADPGWAEVVAALEAKHPGAVTLAFGGDGVREALGKLRALHPRHTCFVAKPAEATRGFVTAVHQLTRALDDDPYADTRWGILTGFDAENALAIARTREPLVVERVGSGTEVALEKCREGRWFCELVKGKTVARERGGAVVESTGPDDTTRALAELLTGYKSQLFVTSGHATERDWQIGFRYRNGYFKSEGGTLYGHPTGGGRFAIQAPEPKVYLPIGNCLMGHIDGADAMALAWMHSAGVRQMAGYTVPTWYGYAGWGCLDYFVEQPGRYSLNEAFFANQHALVHRLGEGFPELAGSALSSPEEAMRLRAKAEPSPAAEALGLGAQDGIGLLFDRDAVAFYGDPAWDARMADGPLHYEQDLDGAGGVFTFTVRPALGDSSFDPVNGNGSQRGGRPFVAFFPERLGGIELLEGGGFRPVITDDFILVANPGGPAKELKVVFRAEALTGATPR